MRRQILVLTVLPIILFLAAADAHAAISMTADRTTLDFRAVDPGSIVELADQGSYHNEITCTSTNNKTWYLKANIVRPFTSGMNTIPSNNLKWIVVSAGDGKGTISGAINMPTSFTTIPSIIYTSVDLDNTGTAVKIRFRYQLVVPKNQIAGAYDAVIRLTMNELL